MIDIKTRTADCVTNTPAGNVVAVNVQGAVNELDTKKVKVSGDTMTGVLTQNGANLAGSAYQSQSFQNLLKNGDFESWSAGASAVPDAWVELSDVNTAKESTIVKYGSASLKVVSGSAGGGGRVFIERRLDADWLLITKNRTLSVGVWIYANDSDIARISLESDGTGGINNLSPFHNGNGAWQFLSVTSVIPNDIIYLNVNLYNIGTNKIVYFDGAILVEGSTVPAFTPRPLYDDGKTIQIDSTINKVTHGGLVIQNQTPQVLTGAGAVDVTSLYTHLITAGVGDALTLVDGVEGQTKTILTKTETTGGDTSVLTPTSFANGSTITFDAVGDVAQLLYSNGAWHYIGGFGGVIA